MDGYLGYAAGQLPALHASMPATIGPKLYVDHAPDFRDAASAHRIRPGPVEPSIRGDHDFLARHLEGDVHASQVP
jgi:hypothetical protein